MRELIRAIHCCQQTEKANWEGLGISIKANPRPQNIKGPETNVILPNKDYIINARTGNYLVLIAKDKRNVIMPKYLDFVKEKIEQIHKENGESVNKITEVV